ncbi:TPA: hypothetical protein ACS74J_003844, partial [Providencia alcalifaciens]
RSENGVKSRIMVSVKLGYAHLNAQLQPLIEATPLARLTAFFKETKNLLKGFMFARLNQGGKGLCVFLKKCHRFAGLDGHPLRCYLELSLPSTALRAGDFGEIL